MQKRDDYNKMTEFLSARCIFMKGTFLSLDLHNEEKDEENVTE